MILSNNTYRTGITWIKQTLYTVVRCQLGDITTGSSYPALHLNFSKGLSLWLHWLPKRNRRVPVRWPQWRRCSCRWWFGVAFWHQKVSQITNVIHLSWFRAISLIFTSHPYSVIGIRHDTPCLFQNVLCVNDCKIWCSRWLVHICFMFSTSSRW